MTRTRYGIRYTDGRWLALAYQAGQIIPIWVESPAKAWTWEYATSALLAALDPAQLDLAPMGPWTVEPWAVSSNADTVSSSKDSPCGSRLA